LVFDRQVLITHSDHRLRGLFQGSTKEILKGKVNSTNFPLRNSPSSALFLMQNFNNKVLVARQDVVKLAFGCCEFIICKSLRQFLLLRTLADWSGNLGLEAVGLLAELQVISHHQIGRYFEILDSVEVD